MIVGLGIDVVEIDRIRALYQRHSDRFVGRILTNAEREYVLRHRDPTERLAGRWAAKEAAFKALGTGLDKGLRWQDVEVLPNADGKPELTFHGKASDITRALEANRIHVSISHSQLVAMAEVILERV